MKSLRCFITTGELEVIGTPADVRAQCNHDAVMRAPWPAAGMPFERHFVGLHDPQHTLAIDWRLSLAFRCRFMRHRIRRYP